MQDNGEGPQDSLLPPLFASRPLIRLKSQQPPKGDIINVTHKKVLLHTNQIIWVFKFTHIEIRRRCGRMNIKGMG